MSRRFVFAILLLWLSASNACADNIIKEVKGIYYQASNYYDAKKPITIRLGDFSPSGSYTFQYKYYWQQQWNNIRWVLYRRK